MLSVVYRWDHPCGNENIYKVAFHATGMSLGLKSGVIHGNTLTTTSPESRDKVGSGLLIRRSSLFVKVELTALKGREDPA